MDSNSSIEDDEEMLQMKEQMKQLEEKMQQKRSLKKTSNKVTNTSPSEKDHSFPRQIPSQQNKKTENVQYQHLSKSSTPSQSTPLEKESLVKNSEWQRDYFRTYKKLPGTKDLGKEYEQLMCTFYALKLLACDDVENFEMTTNNKEYGLFDDIELKVTFKDKKTRIYLFQLKHKENAKLLTKQHLYTGKQKGDFDVKKYFKSMSTDIKVREDVVYILYTNSATYIQDSMDLSEKIIMTKCDSIERKDLLLNAENKEKSSIFQIKKEEENQMFYLFTDQNNLQNTKLQVEEMLRNLVHCDIYGSFVHFMTEWWSQSFVLSKDDVIAKLTELAFTPYMKTLGSHRQNDKTVNIKEAIMEFQVTIVENTDEDIVENIWTKEKLADEVSGKIRAKFVLKSTDEDKVLWYFNKVPLVVKIDNSNKTMIKHVVKLMTKAIETKKIVFLGNLTEDQFEGLNVFRTLSDLVKYSKHKGHCSSIINSFEISLQGKESTSLNRLIKIDKKVAKHVGVNKLLQMSQTKYVIGQHKKELLHLHIPRRVSSIFVKTEKILCPEKSLMYQSIIIVDCDPTFKNKFLVNQNFPEISEALSKESKQRESSILLSTKHKCTHHEFNEVCNKYKNSNVYLFQIFDDEFSVLLMKKGDEVPKYLHYSKSIMEKDILHHFDNPLNVICAPPGMGKSTLIKVLYNNCPPDFWGIYVDLINCNSFLAKKPDFEAIRDYFLGLEKGKEKTFEEEIKITLWQNNKVYLYLDGLDEVDSSCVDWILDFSARISSNGVNVWISSRENLRDSISKTLNVVSVDIQKLDKEQREEYTEW